ncbi:putative tyrosinase-like protein tyr-3 [Mercenaria mercenaria]|uniref:putative tyrosinase-like protein tyr-3 n=1 Tax=Mercenaria mercenaria TaxID=6596 RepID=UPI00234E7818|nr:putative tyrosinase-like protein tyr-3 [Mercenaria mercenaria]
MDKTGFDRTQNRTIVIFIMCCLLTETVSQTDVCVRVPAKTSDCLQSSEYHPVPKDSVTQSCLQELLWDFTTNQNLTADEVDHFKRISRRYLDSPSSSPSGFRQRREYRQLNDLEREKLHRSFQILYDEGTIHRYGKLYGLAYTTVRKSPAFLGFQRVFLLAFEEELRRIDNTVSLPYWDFTIDTEMDNPVNSILWSRKYFGNGNGRVKTGDFRDWRTPKGYIQRRYGESNYGKLMSRDVVKTIVYKCKTKDVTYPVRSESEEIFVLEYHHNGILNWLGGSAADAKTAAYDPVFYMLSACTDFIWEIFRKIQLTECNINPSMDYPTNTKAHKQGAFDKMPGFSQFSNVHGYSNYWSTFWYNYTLAQGCPNCNSKYQWCSTKVDRCISHSRRTDYNVGRNVVSANEAFEPDTEYVPHRVEIPFMPSPLNDGRTMASAKLDARKAVTRRRSSNKQQRNLFVLSALGRSSLISDSLSAND